MSKVKRTRSQIASKIEAIKKITDDPQKGIDSIFDKYTKDLPSTDQFLGKKLDGFSDNRKKKKDNSNNIFEDLIFTAESFLGMEKRNPKSNKLVSESSDDLIVKSKIKKYAIKSSEHTLNSFQDIVSNNVKKIFFAADGICGSNTSINIDSISLSPKEIDFLNVLTIDPSSNTGKIIYEPSNNNTNKQKVNRELYGTFSGSSYTFTSNTGTNMFTANWNAGTQKFDISGLTQGSANIEMSKFLTDYYSSILYPDIKTITKNAMMSTIQSDGSDTVEFTKAQNTLDRLLKKLFSVCGPQTNKDILVNQNPGDQVEENDEDLDLYFDFNEVEGIDLDSEDAKVKKVLRFADCNNYEIPTNKSIIKDFVYLSDKTTINDVVDDTLSRVASEAYQQSNGSIPLPNFNLSILNSFILNLPKTLVSSVMTPKILLPAVILYKLSNSLTNFFLSITDLIVKLKKLIYNIVKELFWKFIRKFWSYIKNDLLIFLQRLVLKILKNKYKRYLVIISALIALLKRILQSGINNCADLFGIILSTINGALSAGGGINIPGFLLGFSDFLPGYSQDRAFLNISERMSSSGVETGPIYGEPNKLLNVVKSMIDGHQEEMDQNSFVKASNKEVTVPTPVGPIIIPPGIINVAGKVL